MIKFKKLCKTAVAPTKATAGAAGYDLVAVSCTEYLADGRPQPQYGTGLAFDIPADHVGLLFPRSSSSKTGFVLANCVGVIDSDYRGEVCFRFLEVSSENSRPYLLGERVGQLVIIKLADLSLEEVDELDDTIRGVGGYGSTGNGSINN